MLKSTFPSGVQSSVLGPVGFGGDRPCSPDIMLGAYLVNHLQQRCENCGTGETPQWRKGWFSSILNRTVVLCNACGLKFNKNQYCPYCMYVYYKEEDKKAQNTWVSCDTCHRWVHIECELKYGAEAVAGFQQYRCPACKNPSQFNAVNISTGNGQTLHPSLEYAIAQHKACGGSQTYMHLPPNMVANPHVVL